MFVDNNLCKNRNPQVIHKDTNKQGHIKYAYSNMLIHLAQALTMLVQTPKIQTPTWEFLKSSRGVELGQHLENHWHLSDNFLTDVAKTF